MNPAIKKALLILLAFVCGYGAMNLLITFVQEVLFGGVGFFKSSTLVLLVAGIGTFASAVAAGLIASMILRNNNLIPHIIICILLTIETAFFVSKRDRIDPAWFDLLASLSLVIGILLGWYLFYRFFSKKRSSVIDH